MQRSVWVIIEQGVEYNDSTYDIAGEATVNKNAFNTKEEAQKAANERLKETISGFRLSDFDEYSGYFRRPGFHVEIDQFFALNAIASRETRYGTYYDGIWDLRWEDFIAYCEEHGFRWHQFAPELLTVQEVKINDA